MQRRTHDDDSNMVDAYVCASRYAMQCDISTSDYVSLSSTKLCSSRPMYRNLKSNSRVSVSFAVIFELTDIASANGIGLQSDHSRHIGDPSPGHKLFVPTS